jgi:hypothetical protein
VVHRTGTLRRADPIQFDARPSYVYRWFTAHNQHLSALGADGYERLGRQPLHEVTTIFPGWEQDWVILQNHANSRESKKT